MLDLFAGSGALGIEALSRGAARCAFVERDRRRARRAARQSRRARRGAARAARVAAADVRRALQADARRGALYTLVLADPPYATFARVQGDLGRSLGPVLAPHAVIVVETSRGEDVRLPWRLERVKRYGDTQVSFLVASGGRSPGRPAGAKGERGGLMPRNVTAIVPGTFDPVTVGHLDIITRGASKFGRVVVGLIENPIRKWPLFSLEERGEFLREALKDYDNVEVDSFNELVVEFARKWDAQVILKGLRAISDFEYEFAMAQLNRKLAPDIETVFMMASPEHSFLSSSGVKEIASFGGSVEDLVPPVVARRLREMLSPRG